jgi:hypothetical protein
LEAGGAELGLVVLFVERAGDAASVLGIMAARISLFL